MSCTERDDVQNAAQPRSRRTVDCDLCSWNGRQHIFCQQHPPLPPANRNDEGNLLKWRRVCICPPPLQAVSCAVTSSVAGVDRKDSTAFALQQFPAPILCCLPGAAAAAAAAPASLHTHTGLFARAAARTDSGIRDALAGTRH